MRVVLLHGFTHTGASWSSVIAGLEPRFQPLAPDLRGHGAASSRTPVDLEHVIEDVSALSGDSFTLVGYSMGGRVALHVALAVPDRVGRLVLIGASPGIADPDERAARRRADEELAARIEVSGIEEFARSWARTPVLADQPSAIREAVHLDRLRSTPGGLARALRGLGTGALPSLWGGLGELTIPVDLVVGEGDLKFRQTAEQMLARMPTARLHTVPGVGHAVHLESPTSVARRIGHE